MNLNLPSNQLILANEEWTPAAQLDDQEPDHGIRQALRYPNLLTDLLAALRAPGGARPMWEKTCRIRTGVPSSLCERVGGIGEPGAFVA